MKSKLIFVGGFLGAGKTTLLWECARRLTSSGQRIQLITNDQASELVDTAFLERTDGIVTEVSGSCFCCNFNGLTGAISTSGTKGMADIIIAEPVGSCTDLSATLIQPLKEIFGDALQIAPLSVLVDPVRLIDILNGGTSGLHESAAYILRKQLEEADLIVISKTDLLNPDALDDLVRKTEKEWPMAKVLSISTIAGDGLDRWLTEVLGSVESGTHLADVDYDIYAEGEAVLGWLNVSFSLSSEAEVQWDDLTNALLKKLDQSFTEAAAPIGHVKILLESGNDYTIGNLTGGAESLCVRGHVCPSKNARLTVNARVEMSPDELQAMVIANLADVIGNSIKFETQVLNSLSPGRPNPTHRYDHIVKAK